MCGQKIKALEQEKVETSHMSTCQEVRELVLAARVAS